MYVILLLFLFKIATAREFTGEEIASFPELFHLDDYDKCLGNKDGLYCLGVFDLSADVHPNPTYELLKAYSDESYRHFNRTRIHRGFCVSSRCPHESGTNASQRFENCADNWARARTLRASIHKFHYCHTHKDRHEEKPMTSAQQIFLQCVYAIVLINVVGTIYDVYTGDSPDKNRLITAFSIPANWRRLTIIQEGGDPRIQALSPLNGPRVITMLMTTYAHANVFHYAFHILNPEELEAQTQRVDGIFLSNGTAVIQGLAMLSCFLTCYNLLLFSQKIALNIAMLPLCVIKRLIRISPVNFLVIGFAATWWMNTRDGPLVPVTIGQEARACQNKFWSQIFYTNNMVEQADFCVVPTWFLAADMHLYIIVCALTLIMWRRRTIALKLYSILFVLSCAVIAIIVYFKKYKAIIYISTPEEIRRTFRDSESFTSFYISSWGSLPSCFLGLILAHIQYEIDEKRIKLYEHKWFVYLYYLSFVSIFMWPLTGMFVRDYSKSHDNPVFSAAYTALDRPIICFLMGVSLLGIVNIDGALRRFFSWNKWIPLARLSLTVMLLHWCVNLSIGTRPVAYGTSILDMVVDWTATNVITYALAVPITVMLEIPIQKFLGLLLF